jgi:hypothetical protein
MKVSELEAGKLYAYRNRRCRVERCWTDADGVAHALISLGRKFENSMEVHGSGYYNKDDIRTLTNTWDDHKQIKEEAKARGERAKNLSLRLREVLEDRNMRGWLSADGQMNVHGSLDDLERLISELEGNSRKQSGSALEALLGDGS